MPIGEEWVHVPGKSLSAFLIWYHRFQTNFESVCHYFYVSHLYQFCLKMYFCCTGTLATQLTVSDTCVWALNPNGEILCRYGISLKNPTGDYWRKVPGVFYQISGTLQVLSLWTILLVINY